MKISRTEVNRKF